MLAKQIDLEEAIGSFDDDADIKVTYTFPASQKEVHDAAHAIITETMRAGRAANGNLWRSQDPLGYHIRKAVVHLIAVHHEQKLTVREKEPPHLKHLFNAVTRMCMAYALSGERQEITENNPDD